MGQFDVIVPVVIGSRKTTTERDRRRSELVGLPNFINGQAVGIENGAAICNARRQSSPAGTLTNGVECGKKKRQSSDVKGYSAKSRKSK